MRRNLDRLGLGKDLQRIKRGSREYLLPPSTLPGAVSEPEPKPKTRKTKKTRTAAKPKSPAKAKA